MANEIGTWTDPWDGSNLNFLPSSVGADGMFGSGGLYTPSSRGPNIYSDGGWQQGAVGSGFSVQTGPGRQNVTSADGTFSPFFGNNNPHPSLTSHLDPYQATLEGLASRAQDGDAAAAEAYSTNSGYIQTASRLYKIAYDNGLNDRNSFDAFKMAIAANTRSTSGRPMLDDQYLDEHVGYLSREALQRGQNVNELAAAQTMMDSSFDRAFTAALEQGELSNNQKAAAIKRAVGQTSDPAAAVARLGVKNALQRWEEKNGLRDDAMRSAIMKQAGEYYAIAMGTDGLEPLAGDFDRLIDAAATKAGATGYTEVPNVFDRFINGAGRVSNGFVTFFGDAETDASAGVFARDPRTGAPQSKPRFQSVVESCFRNLVARNTMADSDDPLSVGAEGSDSRRMLKAELLDGMRSTIPGAAARTPAMASVLNQMADEIIGQAETGQINLAEIAQKHVDEKSLSSFKSEMDAVVPKNIEGFNEVSSSIGAAFTDLVHNRSWISGNLKIKDKEMEIFGEKFNGKKIETGLEPEYTEAGIRSRLERAMAENQDFKRANPELAKQVVDTAANFIYMVNNRADPGQLTDEGADAYKASLQERLSVMVTAAKLKSMGVDTIDLGKLFKYTDPDKEKVPYGDRVAVSGLDKKMSGSGRKYMKATYRNLQVAVDDFMKSKGWQGAFNAEGLSPEDYAKYHVLLSIKDGFDQIIKSGRNINRGALDERTMAADAAALNAKDILGVDLRRNHGRAVRDQLDFMAMPAFVRARDARATQRSSMYDPGPEGAAWKTVMSSMMSDATNPVASDRADRLASSLVERYGSRMSSAEKTVWTRELSSAASRAIKDSGLLYAPKPDAGSRTVEEMVSPMLEPLTRKISARNAEIIDANINERTRMAGELEATRIAERERNK